MTDLTVDRQQPLRCKHGNVLALEMPLGSTVSIASIEFPCGCRIRPERGRSAMKRRPLLGARDVGERLGLQPDAVKRIPADELPFFRANSRGDRRYTLEDVERYIAERRVAW